MLAHLSLIGSGQRPSQPLQAQLGERLGIPASVVVWGERLQRTQASLGKFVQGSLISIRAFVSQLCLDSPAMFTFCRWLTGLIIGQSES